MPSTEETNLLQAITTYLPPLDVEHVRRTLDYARTLRDTEHLVSRAAGPVQQGGNPRKSERVDKLEKSPKTADPAKVAHLQQDPGYVIGVAQTLADAIHIDAISLAAVLLYQAVESKQVNQDEIRQGLGGEFGEAVAQTLANIELFDTLQRPGETLRRSAASTAGDSNDAARSRSRERQRQQDAENLRKMFVGMTEDPRVAVFKIADQLRLMRSIREAADYWHFGSSSHTIAGTATADRPGVPATPPSWTADECRLAAKETRDIYAPLAGRLGMGHVESELDDLAFAVLEPDDYAWLSTEVTNYIQERGSYVERVCDILRKEMRSIGVTAEISGRVKHLASIYRKVQRLGTHDLSSLYDILAFRIIVPTTADCYMALGHVHALWKPVDGRIKDFIANPKSNGYQSLHTTVFCLDDRLAEIQIRTRQMHEQAEYGVAMHWYYKDVGDNASAAAKTLQDWVLQAKEWQQELQAAGTGNAEYALESVRDNVLTKEQIFVFTPAGDVKELPAGATPLDFAYLVHTDVGNHVAGVRILTTDSNGRLVKKLVPLDYELKNGEVIEIIKRKDAHPTRDWLRVARTKSARDKIGRYLKAHERDIDLQIGRERLDRELRSIGIRKGFEELIDEDLDWLVSVFVQPDLDSLLVSIGSDKLRLSKVMEKVRERLLPPAAADTDAVALDVPVEGEGDEAEQIGASVGGLSGLLTRLATCCNPLPTDELLGYVTRGRGVVIHRADCANLAHLLSKEPGRAVPVEWPRKLGGHEHFRASVVVEARDRTGLLADVTGVITNRKINMIRQTTATKSNKATITAVLEISRPEQLGEVLEALREVPSVLSAERRRSNQQETHSRNHPNPSN
jgi:GTP diphosphokinase / guanosine-3',5'-bis(diphosphate) 3'-diphosphatase